MSWLTTVQAAKRLGISVRRVQQLIGDGVLPAEKAGRDYLIDEKNLKLAEDRNPVGRPRKSEDKSKGKKKGK